MEKIRHFFNQFRRFFNQFALSFDRSFAKGTRNQLLWLVTIVLIVYVVLVGLTLLVSLYTPGGEDSQGRWYDVLFVLVDPGPSNSGMSAPFTLLCAILGLVIFGGMLISVMSNVLERRVESYSNGTTDYKLKNHVVVMGFNKSIPSLLVKIHKTHPNSFILLMTEQDTEKVRNWIHSKLDSASDSNKDIESNLVILNGVWYADDDMDRLCLEKLDKDARIIYVLGEDNDPAHDSKCLRAFELIAKKVCEKTTFYVKMNDGNMFSILQRTTFNELIMKKLEIIPYSFYEIWSQNVLCTIPNDKYLPLDGDGSKGITADSTKHVHLIIVGMTEMGYSLAVNAAHILHFPNHKLGQFDTYSHITFIDTSANKLGNAFRKRYHNLFEFAPWKASDSAHCLTDDSWIDPMSNLKKQYSYLGTTNFMDIKWEFIEGDLLDDNIQQYLIRTVSNYDNIVTLALCGESSEQNATYSLSLPEDVRMQAHQILVRQTDNDEMIQRLNVQYGYQNIRAFGMMADCYGENLISDRYGKLINACHMGIDPEDDKKVDESWSNCTMINRWSSIYCANMIYYKLRLLGLDTTSKLTEEEIIAAKESHLMDLAWAEQNRWIAERLLLGCRPLYEGAETQRWDENQKESNGKEAQSNMKTEFKNKDLVPFEMLDDQDKKKNDSVNNKFHILYKKTQEPR